jgi:outer membrane protein TolC
MQAANRIAETAVNARSEVRESYLAYRTAYDTAKHYGTEIVPLRKQISEEMVLRYNGMLASVFELLADSREQVSAVSAYIDALGQFWLADADLQNALTGGRSFGTANGRRAPEQRAAGSPAGGH